jgi:hypothetical protein
MQSEQVEHLRGLSPRQVGVWSTLSLLDPADDRWCWEAPLRAALIDTVFAIHVDDRRKIKRFESAKQDLVELLEVHGDDALRELEEILRAFGSRYAELVVARYKARTAIASVVHRRVSTDGAN